MALCLSGPNPVAEVTDGLIQFIALGDNESHPGDYTVAGVGTRRFGAGVIRLSTIPPKTSIVKAYLIYNTYQTNSPVAHPSVTLKRGTGAAVPLSGSLWGICGSTCWFNPPFEATTYLRNRVYVADATTIVTGNGSYTVAGLPVTPAARLGTDGDRIPGCFCSQGAILFVLWEWNDDAGPRNRQTNELDTAKRFRGIRAYIGAKLLSNNGVFGLTPTYNLPFEPIFDQDMSDPPIKTYYKGNSHIEIAAGDAQNSIPGDSFAINQVRFATPNNAFTKIGSSLCVRKFSVANIYDGENSAYAKTTNDCICWFFFVISGDKTQPQSQFEIVNCAATYLLEDAQPNDPQIIVYSNFVQTPQTIPGNVCRAVAYQPPLVGPPPPGMPLPPPNPPGMFPKPPFYIKIDREIMRVTAKGGAADAGPGPPIQPGLPDFTTWKVERGQAGTLPAFHAKSVNDTTTATCVYMLAPPRFIRDIHAGLAARGQAPQRPNAARPAVNQRRR